MRVAASPSISYNIFMIILILKTRSTWRFGIGDGFVTSSYYVCCIFVANYPTVGSCAGLIPKTLFCTCGILDDPLRLPDIYTFSGLKCTVFGVRVRLVSFIHQTINSLVETFHQI